MRLLVAGGGTGGHLFPGIAVAEEVLARRQGNEVLFVGTDRGIEARVLPRLGYPLERIEVSGIKGTGLQSKLRGLIRLPRALWDGVRIVRRFRPDVAMGVGGYASGPAILAARLLGVPCVVLEQNSVPGITNRILGRLVHSVFTMFPESEAHFPRGRVHLLGNPIRKQLLANFLIERPSRSDESFRILVLGGSQGARGLNARVLKAARALRDANVPVAWVHQTGEQELGDVRQGYARAGVEDVEVSAFIDDMSAAYASADLVVCRAGATTLAEVLVTKLPSILVPFPFATDNHQELNARSLERGGAAIVMLEAELDGERLATVISELRADPERLRAMSRAAARLGRPEAAREVVDACEGLLR